MEKSLLQLVLETAIQVLLPVLLSFIVVLVKRAIDYFQANVDKEKLEFVVNLVNQFVMAAEQSGLAGAIANEGAAKKAWVLEQLQKELDAKGIKVDVAVLEALIEAQVLEMFNWGRVRK